jgi:hypothetical protein
MRQASNYLLTLAAAVAIVFNLGPIARATTYPVTGTWVNAVGFPTGTIMDGTTNNPIVGDAVDDPSASSDAAKNAEVYSPFPDVTLAQAGDTITFTGSVLLQGTVNSAATSGTPRTQFRFGLFQDNGDANNNGWVGYLMTNSHGNGTPNGSLSRKPSGNTSTFLSTNGATTVLSTPGNGTVFNDDTYALSLSIQRLATGDLQLSSSITGTAATNFTESFSGTDPAATVPSYAFNRLGFLTGSNLGADRAAYTSLTVTTTGPSFGGGGVAGDYNGNGIVDAADYVLWRSMNGQSGTGLAADGNGDSMVDAADFDYWRARFGNAPGSGALTSGNVPEPTTLLLFAMALGAPLAARRRQRVTAAAK